MATKSNHFWFVKQGTFRYGHAPRQYALYRGVESGRLARDRMNAADRALWLLSLRSQYKAKRNFIKELPIS